VEGIFLILASQNDLCFMETVADYSSKNVILQADKMLGMSVSHKHDAGTASYNSSSRKAQ
jgi:hypothetical protein